MTIKTYSEAGRGRKKCPNCPAYIAIRSSACACGHIFNAEAYKRSLETHNNAEKGPTFYDGPGAGRKLCPGCEKYIGARNRKCSCGHEFKSAPAPEPAPKPDTPPKKIVVFDGPGPKRKKCPDCDKFLGRKATECICGHKFTFEPKEAKKSERFIAPCKSELEANQFAQGFGGQGMIVTTPAGACPVKLKDTHHETVGDWCAKVVDAGQQNGKTYAPSALRYFVREFFEYGTHEYAVCCENIEEWAQQFMCGAA